MNRVFCL